jgi:hypothetical protein
MQRSAILAVITTLAMTGCLRSTEYQCSTSSACGANGQCEATGYCSILDAECASGRRYSDAAGQLAGRCVDDGGNPMHDGGPVDMALDGAMTPDAPASAACPSGYVTLPNGQAGHMYMVVSNAANWAAQRTACAATSPNAYLAIPDAADELAAMSTANGLAANYWVGVSDIATEGQWVTVKNTPQTFLPWVGGTPGNQNPGDDCVEVIPSLNQFNDARCNQSKPAICECSP